MIDPHWLMFSGYLMAVGTLLFPVLKHVLSEPPPIQMALLSLNFKGSIRTIVVLCWSM
jgi:hypothetical protein